MTDISKTKFIDLDSVRSENYSSNIERHGEHNNTCFICGKRTYSNLFVHYTTDGYLVDEFDELLVPNSQGLFPIGLECAKKLHKSFITNS